MVSAKFDLSDLEKWPLERFNQIYLLIYDLCHPKEAPCKKVIEAFLRLTPPPPPCPCELFCNLTFLASTARGPPFIWFRETWGYICSCGWPSNLVFIVQYICDTISLLNFKIIALKHDALVDCICCRMCYEGYHGLVITMSPLYPSVLVKTALKLKYIISHILIHLYVNF